MVEPENLKSSYTRCYLCNLGQVDFSEPQCFHASNENNKFIRNDDYENYIGNTCDIFRRVPGV